MKKLFLLFLILILLIPLGDLFKSGLPLTHDGQDHIARIANFYQSLTEGNLIPRWAGNLNWGYGHPILMFLYPLASYLASFFHFMGYSLVDSAKLVFGLSFILSGVFMYLWVKEFWGEEAGFTAGVIYVFAPYRLVDLYVRGAIGECLAFVWPPLICYFTLKLCKNFKYQYLVGGSLSLAALILSHNAVSLMFLPFTLGYGVYLIFNFKKSHWLQIMRYLLMISLGFALPFFFWFPAFVEGKYTLRDIVTKNQITGFEPINRLIWSGWNYGGTGSFSVQVGLAQWLVIILTPLIIWKFYKRQNRAWSLLAFLLINYGLAIFLITPASKFLYLQFSLLQKFQFAWRWLSLAIFPPAVLAGALVYLWSKKNKLLVVAAVFLVSILLTRNHWQAKDYLLKDESFFTLPYAGTTDTGESSPRWSVRFMEEFPKARYEVIEGETIIEEVSRTTTKHVFKIKAAKETRLLDNTLYFPNWQVLANNQPVEVEFQDIQYRGLITFKIPKGEHLITVQFKETKLRNFADLVSLASILLILAIFFVLKLNHQK